jgi:hypothetical protein
VEGLFAIALMIAVAAPAFAHHGAASFDTSKEVTLKGTVTEYIWAGALATP